MKNPSRGTDGNTTQLKEKFIDFLKNKLEIVHTVERDERKLKYIFVLSHKDCFK